MEKIAHIGGGKSSLIEMMSDIIESDRGVVIIDDGKIVHGELPKMPERQLRHDELLALRPYDIPVDAFRDSFYAPPKPKKPNSGLTIGSYKFKSKKK